MSLNVTLTRISPLYPTGFFIQWSLSGVDSTLSGLYEFELFTSGSPKGPWYSVSGKLFNTFAFWDKHEQPLNTTHDAYRRPNNFAINRTTYYRIVVKSPKKQDNTQDIAEYIDDTDPALDPKQAQYWRKGVYNFQKMLIINGVPVAILKRRHWGERCNSCYDKTTRDVNRSKCIVCYGTGFKFGYFDPVYTKVKRSAPESNSQLTPEGRIDSNSTKIHCAYTPQLDTQDIIVFLRDNRRFIVDQQTETQITTVTVHQVVNALELSRDNIAFRLKVDNKAIQALY